ncbi:hypothetical protein V8F20_010098 [Naviculisporaceae sp. PSN 640]
MKPTDLTRWAVSLLGLLCAPDLARGAPSTSPSFNESSLTDLLATVDDNGAHTLEKRAKLFALRILPLGASIVYGYMSPGGNSFRKYLRDQLRYDGWDVNMVGSQRNGDFADNDVEASSGFLIDQVAALARNSYHYKANVVVIHVGTNDVRANLDIANFGLRIRALVDSLFLQPGFDKATIVLSTLIGIKEPQFTLARASANTQIRAEVTRYQSLGKAVVVAEMVPDGVDFVRASTDYADLVHPNGSGCKRMAAVFWQAIRNAEALGYLQAPELTEIALGSRGGTCDKIPGKGLFGGTTQKGSGFDDGVYSHQSQSMGVVTTITRNWDRGQWFLARLFTKDRDDIVGWYNTSDTENRFGVWRNMGTTTNTFVRMANDLNTTQMCQPIGIRFHDLNADGLDDFICVFPEGDAFAAINNGDGSSTRPPTFRAIGRIRPQMSGYGQSRVRFGDVDGDGRADFCVLESSGDMRCWRNGGWGDAPAYWQPLGKRFTGKGMGDLNGVRFEDINGDGRDNWLWVSDTGAVTTWTNSRSCIKGREGDGLNIVWREAASNPTHSGMSTPSVRGRIHFGRVFSDPVDIGLQRKLDYVYLEHVNRTDGRHDFKVRVWKNNGSGATKIKADGNKYCNMKGHANGRQDYVWTYNSGTMVLYPNKGSIYVSDTQSFWDAAITIWNPVEQGIGRQLHRRDLHLMDYDGDGVCDIVWTDPDNNYRMSVWRNRYKETGQWLWDYLPNPAPTVTCDQKTGLGFHDLAVRFADISGNGKDDYICLEKDGRAKGYVHNDAGGWDWIDQYKFSEGKDRANLRFHDVNGDGRADLIWVNKWNGNGYVWYNRGRRDISGSRFEWGRVGDGKAFDGHVAGTCTYFADLDGNKRWDLHEVGHSLDNTADTWFNVCGSGDGGGDDPEGVRDPGLDIPPGGIPGSGGSGPGGPGNVCTGGSGFGPWFELCAFTCKYGNCPEPCSCTSTGPGLIPPTKIPGIYALSRLGPEYDKSCEYTCTRGTSNCPDSACVVGTESWYLGPTATGSACTSKMKGKWACMAGPGICSVVIDDHDRNDTNSKEIDKRSWNYVQANDMIPEAHAMWKNFRDDDHWKDTWYAKDNDFLRGMVHIWGGPKAPEFQYEIPCGRTTLVALDLIMKAMQNVYHFYERTYNSWTAQRSGVQRIAEDLSKDFGPDNNVDKGLEIFLAVFGVFSTIMPFVQFKSFQKAADMVSGGMDTVASVFDVIANEMESDAEEFAENAKASLELAADALVNASKAAADQSVKFLFGGSDDGLAKLNDMMKDGAFSTNWTGSQLSDFDIAARTEKIMRLKLIPAAWGAGGAYKPVVLYMNGHHNQFVSSRGYINPGDQEWTRHHYTRPNGEQFTLWLLVYQRLKHTLCPNRNFCVASNFEKLHPDGGEIYERYGVTWQQIAISSFEGWLANDKKNNYPQQDIDTSVDDPIDEPWRTPGFFNLPVCTFASMQNRMSDTDGCAWDPCCHTEAS